MATRFLFCTFVYGWYQSFIPSYVYSILKSYPQYACRILLRESLEPGVRTALQIVREAVDGQFEVIENVMPHLVGRCAGMRWLLGEEHFAGYDYGWIGDIDFLHVREEPSFLAQEIDRATAIGKPYANVVRSPPAPKGVMTGLHFIVVKPYFARMQPIIAAALQDPNIIQPDGKSGAEGMESPPSRGSISIPSTGSDEFLLYHLVKQGCGVLEADETRPYCWQNHHGLHLGVLRSGRTPLPSLSSNTRLWSALGDILHDPVISAILSHLHPAVVNCIQAAQCHYYRTRA